ncbi:MAG: nitroreductase family protein [Thermoleophilia bacterium]
MSAEPGYRDLFPDLPEPVYEPLAFTRRPPDDMRERAAAWYAELDARRTTRDFSTEPVPRELIELAIRSAGTAPSGAHTQPWTFVAIGDPELKRQIREAAEQEERRTYTERMSEEWRRALAPLGTDWVKTHITDAPWVVVLFKRAYELAPDGTQAKNYYVSESVGIAAGLFIAAVHHMGLATLTHTPNPMGFLRDLLGRPRNETAVLLFPVGYPAPDARVPRLARKPLDEIAVWLEG